MFIRQTFGARSAIYSAIIAATLAVPCISTADELNPSPPPTEIKSPQNPGNNKNITIQNGDKPETDFHGLKFGIGLSLAYPFDYKKGGINEAEVDGAGIVRVTKESKRTPRILLESHYFFPTEAGAKWYCPQSGKMCGQGPFVAIEAGGDGKNTISAYALGWMLGFQRDKSSSNSWNIGIGYLVRTGVRVLGDGIEANAPLPTGDKIRYKEISQSGWMWMTSFSF